MKNNLLSKTKTAISGFILSSAVLSGTMPHVDAATPVTLSKSQFLQMFLQTVNVKPDPNGKSPYKDVSSKEKDWGYVHKALELNLVKPDSKTGFGVSDSVSASFASEVAIKYFHMTIGKTTPDEWAKSQGLTTGLAKHFTVNDGNVFLQRLMALSTSLKPYLNSWTLLPGEVSDLNKAFQYLDAAPSGQYNSTMSDSLSFTLSASGKKNKAWIQWLKQYEGTPINIYQIQDTQGAVNNAEAVIVTTKITTPDPTVQTGSSSTQTITDVAYGNNYYENKGDGSGWTTIADSNALTDIGGLAPVFGPGFQNVTAKKVGGAEVFTADISQSAASQFYSSYLYGTVPAKDFKSTLTLDLSNINGQPTLEEEDLNTTVTISPSMFSSLLGLGSAYNFGNNLSSVVITYTSKSKISYGNAQLTLPSGLSIPGWTVSQLNSGISTNN